MSPTEQILLGVVGLVVGVIGLSPVLLHASDGVDHLKKVVVAVGVAIFLGGGGGVVSGVIGTFGEDGIDDDAGVELSTTTASTTTTTTASTTTTTTASTTTTEGGSIAGPVIDAEPIVLDGPLYSNGSSIRVAGGCVQLFGTEQNDTEFNTTVCEDLPLLPSGVSDRIKGALGECGVEITMYVDADYRGESQTITFFC